MLIIAYLPSIMPSNTKKLNEAREQRESDSEGEEREEKCPKCTRPVRERDYGLKCDNCHFWFHAGCAGIFTRTTTP